MCDVRYFKAARHNYDYAVKTKIFYEADEAYVNDIAYNFDFYVEREHIEEALKEIKVFLDMNGLCDELMEEVDKELVKEALPAHIIPQSNFEWNCYYIILVKKKKL